MRDFEKDRRICEAATKGPWHAYYGFKNKHVLGGPDYIPVASGKDLKDEDAAFIAAAREGWPAALDEIENLKRQLQVAAENVTNKTALCPHWATESGDYETKRCVGCNRPKELAISCWQDYWRRESGTFQNGNNQASAEKSSDVGKTVGEA